MCPACALTFQSLDLKWKCRFWSAGKSAEYLDHITYQGHGVKVTGARRSRECNYTVSQKNDTDVAHCNFNAHQPILVIFGRDVAERVSYQMMICYPTSPI